MPRYSMISEFSVADILHDMFSGHPSVSQLFSDQKLVNVASTLYVNGATMRQSWAYIIY